jgi:hypothetical protein
VTRRFRPNCWYYEPGNFTLVLSTRGRLPRQGALGYAEYEVDLERCRTAAEILDWIAQVAGKNWATDQILADLVRALDDVFSLQSTVCPFGNARRIDVKRALVGKSSDAVRPVEVFDEVEVPR